jgi:hypothetical protein
VTLPESWCSTYTRLVPEQDGVRRRAEVASHVHEARAAGTTDRRLAVETLAGAHSDLLWSSRSRRRNGLPPLLAMPFLDATTGGIVAGVMVLLAFGVSVLSTGRTHPGEHVFAGLALLLALSGHGVQLVLRWVRRRRGR